LFATNVGADGCISSPVPKAYALVAALTPAVKLRITKLYGLRRSI
jgi:hypothetical protein